MLTTEPGPDPFFAYKMHHVDRAKVAWALSEELGFYEALRHGPATIEQVCARLKLAYRPTAALLAANACIGILGFENGRYFIYDVMRQMVLDGGRARLKPRPPDPEDNYWYRTTKQAILTNEIVEETLPIWITSPNDEVDAQAFGPDRHGWRIMWGEALAAAFDFSPYRRVADFGGATGGLLVGLTGKYPHLHGILVELPYSKKTAEAALKQGHAEDRVSFFAADFFEDPLPAEIDAIVMSHVIHDWDDERCLHLLRRCHEALPQDSPVIAVELLLSEDMSGNLIGVFQWFGLLASTRGDQRTSAQIEALMYEAGFRSTESRPIDHDQSIVIGWKK